MASVFPLQHQSRTGPLPAPSSSIDGPLPSSPVAPPEEAREQGRRVGRAEATELLAQAEAAKGEPLTRSEVMTCYGARFTEYLNQHPYDEATRHSSEGWYQGFVEVCIQARDAAPDAPAPETEMEPEPEPVAGTVNFRQAQIETDDVEEFTKGIECGQACYVEDSLPITSHDLFTLFAGAIEADDPEAYNIGFILGSVDAVCWNRKLIPSGFWRELKQPKKRTKCKLVSVKRICGEHESREEAKEAGKKG